MNDQKSCAVLASWLASAKSTVAFTGAGISTESGIPDFRSPGGVWQKYQPVYFDAFMNSAQSRFEYWRQKCEAHPDMATAKPNAGHRMLAEWEHQGRLVGVITQNIDGLHRQGGSGQVLELHGTARDIQCLDCGYRTDADPLVDEFAKTKQVPVCPECQSERMKHATISFGQSLPTDTLRTADEWARASDLFLAIGSSLQVTPAADLPRIAKASGARLVIVNRDSTALDSIADLVIHQSIGEFLTAVDSCF